MQLHTALPVSSVFNDFTPLVLNNMGQKDLIELGVNYFIRETHFNQMYNNIPLTETNFALVKWRLDKPEHAEYIGDMLSHLAKNDCKKKKMFSSRIQRFIY